MFDYHMIRPLLFKLQAETAHHAIEYFLRIANTAPSLFNRWIEKHFIDDSKLHQELFGRTFFNPVGLAAGMDKNASIIPGTLALGFGFTEVGTITPKPQAGNPKPRLWRHVKEESLQNAMGFNNGGMKKLKKRLQRRFPFVTPIGVNIGKNKTTKESDALSDYLTLLDELHELGDYLVINISSPNTPGLRDLQNETFIKTLFDEAKEITHKPILLKIAPDMEVAQAVELCTLAVKSGAAGIIATNTSIDHGLVENPYDVGGISGAVIKDKSFELFDAIAKELYGKAILISVGGIDSAQEAYRRLKAGASLVQVFSAIVFHGPCLVRDINKGILELMELDGYKSITEVIGANR
ncbi:MAG: quinone-dependent dihydroorotate dehydrogenase [Thiovulaceae bacterium]|nr:quinone-dependent dihydroorotate dehydrogenase [Sulfurimonadaceae bacterium]